jgi:hypothetical protein
VSRGARAHRRFRMVSRPSCRFAPDWLGGGWARFRGSSPALGARGVFHPRRFGLHVSAQPVVDFRALDASRALPSPPSAADPPRLSAGRAAPNDPTSRARVRLRPCRVAPLISRRSRRAPSFVGSRPISPWDLARVACLRLRAVRSPNAFHRWGPGSSPGQHPRDAARTASRLHRTFFNREPSQASSSSTSPFMANEAAPARSIAGP